MVFLSFPLHITLQSDMSSEGAPCCVLVGVIGAVESFGVGILHGGTRAGLSVELFSYFTFSSSRKSTKTTF